MHARFGGGPSEKDPISGTSPAAYPAGTGDQDAQRREVCGMQGAETVLSVIRDLLYHPKMITGEPVTGKLCAV